MNEGSLEREIEELRFRVSELENENSFLVERCRRAEAISEYTSDGFILVDRELKFSYLSPSFERFNDLQPSSLLGTSPLELVHDEDVEIVAAAMAEVLESPGRSTEIEFRGVTHDGGWLWLETNFHNRLDDPAFEAIVVSFVDVTDRVAAEQELATLHSQLLAVVHNTDECILLSDRNAYPVFYNSAYAKKIKELFGLEMRPGLQPHTFLPPDMGQIWPGFHKRVLAGESFVAEHAFPVGPGQELAFETLFNPVFTDGEVTGFAEITREITDRKRNESERLDLERQFHHAQKLESLGLLASGVTHDFNNLLMAIFGNIDLIQMELDTSPSAMARIAEIEVAASRASELCQQLLAFSGRSRSVLEPCHISSLVREMAKLLEVSIPKKIDLDLELDADLPVIKADPTNISQIVMNLITNASEAIGAAVGTISLTTRVVECPDMTGDECFALSAGVLGGQCVALEVNDSGCGMDPETLPRIFDPFFTTKASGRGLGLAAVQGIIRAHGGCIQVTSEVGTGTNVRILIPVLSAQAPSKENLSDSGLEWRGSGVALVVDDEEIVSQVAGDMLERLGFDVITAADGDEALRIFDSRKEDIRLVLLDVAMPRVDGIDMVQELESRGADVPILLSSGKDEEEVLLRLRQDQKIAGFIQKPYRFSQLREKLRGVFE